MIKKYILSIVCKGNFYVENDWGMSCYIFVIKGNDGSGRYKKSSCHNQNNCLKREARPGHDPGTS